MQESAKSQRTRKKTAMFEQLLKNARTVTNAEIMEGNLRRFERMGLDKDDIERMAKTVDLELHDLLLLDTTVHATPIPQQVFGKAGRKDSTKDIADFAAERKQRRMTWNGIYLDWKRLFPNDKRETSKDTIREAYRRHYGDKSRKKY